MTVPTPLCAQAAPAPPSHQDVDRAPPPADGDALSRLRVSGGPAPPACPLDEPALAGRTIRFAGARFVGLAGLEAAALRPAYADRLGRDVALAELCRVRDAATAILRRAGYVAALSIPAQSPVDGVVEFKVVMARLVRIEVRGSAAPAERRLASYLRKLTDRPLFNTREAERYLLLARDMPGYDVSLALQSADGSPGDVVGILSASRQRIVVEANVQNYGSRQVGRWGGIVSAALNDPFGLGDRLTLGLFATAPVREQIVVQTGYEVRLGGAGLTLAARGTYARTRPAIGGGDPYRSHTWIGTLEAAYPLLRRPHAAITARSGFDLIEQDLTGFDATLTRDRLRVAYLQLDADVARPVVGEARGWRIAGTIEARQGLGLLGASRGCRADGAILICPSPLPSRVQADPAATILRASLAADLPIGGRWAIASTPRLQYAFRPLVAYEQYSAGAYTIGRGYDPAAATGDSGAGAAFELRYDAVRPRAGRPAVQPYAFVDAAWVWNRQALVGELYPQRIVSAGGGLRAGLGPAVRLDLAAAVPLRRAPEQVDRGGTRVLLTLTGRLQPGNAR